MKKENYSYPAIFDYAKEGHVEISFCDFEGCSAYADNEETALQEAREALALSIIKYEELGQQLPNPTPVADIIIGEHQRLVIIDIWMPYWRTKAKEVYIKKTLTIPSWIDVLAKEKNINFSNILVKGLKKELGIEE